MTASDQNFWVFVLLGTPIILVFGGEFGYRALIILAALAGLAYAPMIAIPLFVLWCLRWLLFDFVVAFFAGLGGGLGLRASGFMQRGRARRRSLWRR